MKFPLSFILSFLFAVSTNVANASFPQAQSLTENNNERPLDSARRLSKSSKKSKKSKGCKEVGELEKTIASLRDVNSIQQQEIADLQAAEIVPAEIASDTLEGLYLYLGCGQEYYLANIVCSVEDDICEYSENSVGGLVIAERDGQDATIGGFPIGDPENGVYLMPQDESEPCVFFGSFKLSGALVGNELAPFALDYSATCNVNEEYQYVVRGYTTLIRNGPSSLSESLKLVFSRDNGETYYNEDSVYSAVKMTSEEVSVFQDERRSLVVYDNAPLSTHGVAEYVHPHRKLVVCGGICVGLIVNIGLPMLLSALTPSSSASAVNPISHHSVTVAAPPSLIIPALIVSTAAIICTIIATED